MMEIINFASNDLAFSVLMSMWVSDGLENTKDLNVQRERPCWDVTLFCRTHLRQFLLVNFNCLCPRSKMSLRHVTSRLVHSCRGWVRIPDLYCLQFPKIDKKVDFWVIFGSRNSVVSVKPGTFKKVPSHTSTKILILEFSHLWPCSLFGWMYMYATKRFELLLVQYKFYRSHAARTYVLSLWDLKN